MTSIINKKNIVVKCSCIITNKIHDIKKHSCDTKTALACVFKSRLTAFSDVNLRNRPGSSFRRSEPTNPKAPALYNCLFIVRSVRRQQSCLAVNTLAHPYVVELRSTLLFTIIYIYIYPNCCWSAYNNVDPPSWLK